MTDRTNKKSYVLPNCIDPTLWQQPVLRAVPEENIIIGLTGSVSHKDDWKVLEGVLPEILLRYNNVMLIIGGYHPPYLAGLPRTEYLPGVDYAYYAQIIKACDIILAPVIPHDLFNWSKSPIKVIEGMGAERRINGRCAGAACIATNMPVYQLALEHNKTGMLVEHTPQAWFDAIKFLVENTAFRQRLQFEGYKWVWKHHDMSRQWKLWAKAYSEIMSVSKEKTA